MQHQDPQIAMLEQAAEAATWAGPAEATTAPAAMTLAAGLMAITEGEPLAAVTVMAGFVPGSFEHIHVSDSCVIDMF
jgi:hypothetical protein